MLLKDPLKILLRIALQFLSILFNSDVSINLTLTHITPSVDMICMECSFYCICPGRIYGTCRLIDMLMRFTRRIYYNNIKIESLAFVKSFRCCMHNLKPKQGPY